jgi:hypothetical protein
MKQSMKKTQIENKSHKITKKFVYLPLSIIIPSAFVLLMLISALVFITPLTFSVLADWVYDWHISPLTLICVYMIILSLVIVFISWLLRANEKMKKRTDKEDGTINISVNSNFDSDRSYLEQKIAELSNNLLSSQKRWEEVNHLILSSHDNNITNNGSVSPSEFLSHFNINISDVTVDKRLIFVLTPFHSDNLVDYQTVYETCKNLDFSVMRGDEELIQGDILSHTLKCIVKARIIIANLNGRNPNVFYELGIAHSLNKPTVLISHVENQVPFDLKSKFIVIYDSQEDLDIKLRKILLQLLQS